MRKLKDFPSYGILKDGRVFSFKSDRCLKPIKKGKYWGFTLRANGKTHSVYTHRLVAEAFLPNYSPELHVHHKDGDRTNNHFQNLEMISASDHAKKHDVNSRLTPEQRRKAAESQKKPKPHRRGKGHYRSDPTVYHWISPKGEHIHCTRSELIWNHLEGKRLDLAGLINGKYKQLKGWRLN